MPYQSMYRWLRLFLILHLLLLSAFNLAIGCYLVGGRGPQAHLLDLSGKPVGSDFVTYWAASRVARTQGPPAVFSREAIYAAEREVIGADLIPRLWNYPPTFLLMVLPLSLLPYLASFLSWLAVTCLGYLSVIRRLIPRGPACWLFLLFPGAVSNVLYGQNGFLSATFLGGGLLLIDRYPFLGGCLLGLLSYKPQLACLIPVALAAGRYWRALAGAIMAAAGLAFASLWVLGPNVWISFFNNLPLAASLMAKGHLWEKMPTVLAAARLAGASQDLAMALQAVTAAGALGAVAWIWLRRMPLPIRGSVLAVGILLATPYAFEYDLTLLALPFAWLGWEAYAHDARGDEVFLLLAWTLLAWGTLRPPWVGPGAFTSPFNLTALLALMLWVLYRAAKPLPHAQSSNHL
jgi:hypothetical protein